MNNAARKGAALGAGAAGGLALAALLLPQLASTLNPTKLGTAVLTIALALLTTAGQRLNERRKQRGALAVALRVWPPERLRVADLAALGVYPPRGAGGEPEPYRPRDEDAELREALRHSKLVVVQGPPGAGKSRAASQAAREVLGELPAIVPMNSDALRSLADGSVELNLPEPCVCLWLDGLDRFIETLDPRALESLDGLAGEVRIVATIRTQQWQELLTGTGQKSEAARALDAGARVLELGPLRSTTEDSKHDSAPSEPALAPVRGLPPLWRDGWLVALAAGLVATLVAPVVFGRTGDLVQPRPIDEQMDRIKRQALQGDSAGRRHVVIDGRVRFHPTEADSWILVVQDRPSHDEFYAAAANNVGPPPRSDELRIYDVRDGRLRLKLRFQPKGTGATAAEWRGLGAGASLAADHDSDGSDEVIAGYAIPAQATEALVPFAIDWEADRYRLVSLTPNKPQLSTRGLEPEAIRFRREAYQEPRRFQNAVRDQRFRHLEVAGYRIQTFALPEKPKGRLLSGYFAELPRYAQPKVLELHASQLRSGSPALVPCTPSYYACRAPKSAHDVLVPPDRTLDGALLEAWDAVGGKWVSPIRVTERKR